MKGTIGTYLITALFCANVRSGRTDIVTFTVSVQQTGSQHLQTRCGGTLISLRHVLTSANCLFDNIGGTQVLINPALFRVFAGVIQNTDASLREITRPIANINIHPQYESGQPNRENDIAVITLAEQFTPTIVTPLSLPRTEVIEASTPCILYGWRETNISITDYPRLWSTDYSVYDQRDCKNIYNNGTIILNIIPTMICAETLDTSSSNCIANQGNPLLCHGEFTGFLSLSNNCQPSSLPEIYTRVFSYTEWIQTIVSSSAPSLLNTGPIAIIVMSVILQIFNLRS